MKKLVAYMCYGIFFLAFAIQIWYAMDDTLTFTTLPKIIIITIQVIMLLIGTFINIKTLPNQEKKDDIRFMQIILFLLFLGNLAYLLFFDKNFGRTNHEWGYSLVEYFQANGNLVPFNTINLYLDGYRTGALTWGTVMINLVGNIVSFMPFAYFLPLLFKKQRHIIIFIITMVCIIVGVEIMQVVMQSGSGDIDDLILNMLGVLVVYIVFKLPFLHRWLYGMDE